MTAAEAVPIRVVQADARGQEFAVVYRANVDAITAYFARRCREPQEAPREAAHVLGASANTLRVGLFRARAQLRKETGR